MPLSGFAQWGWPEMEELLQCPVCLDIPAPGIVEQCRHGHHICINCKRLINTCPLCKCDFHGTRNYVVEELVRNYEVLKNTMLLSSLVSEDIKKKKKKCKFNASGPVLAAKSLRLKKVNTPSATKGVYPCRMFDCNQSYELGRLLNHVRTTHVTVLTEGEINSANTYIKTWEIPFENKLNINPSTYIINVRGIGLIFLNIELIKPGHLVAVIQMALSTASSENFLARLEFFNDNSPTFTYNTRLRSIRENIQGLMEKSLCYTLSYSQLKLICVNRKFKCRLSLSLFVMDDNDILTRPLGGDFANILKVVRAAFIEKQKRQQQQVCNPLLNKYEACSSSASSSSLNSDTNENKLSGRNEKYTSNVSSSINMSNILNNNSYTQRTETQDEPPVARSNRSIRRWWRRRRRRNRATAMPPVNL